MSLFHLSIYVRFSVFTFLSHNVIAVVCVGCQIVLDYVSTSGYGKNGKILLKQKESIRYANTDVIGGTISTHNQRVLLFNLLNVITFCMRYTTKTEYPSTYVPW